MTPALPFANTGAPPAYPPRTRILRGGGGGLGRGALVDEHADELDLVVAEVELELGDERVAEGDVELDEGVDGATSGTSCQRESSATVISSSPLAKTWTR